MRAAVIQLNSTIDVDRNLATAEELVRGAAARGASLVALPEKWNLLGEPDRLVSGAEPLDGRCASAAAGWARELGIHLLAGSMALAEPGEELPANASLLFGPDGQLIAVYRKVHMFDVDIGGTSYRESARERPGAEPVLAPLGGELEGIELGMSVCYDLRFPELYRVLAVRGAKLLAVPSAFTRETGRDHWEVLLRARAIESQCFVIAPGQYGKAPPHYRSYGRSMLVDPWGTVLAQVPDGEGFALADLDLDALERIRGSIPSLAHRRPAAYRWPVDEGGAEGG